MINFKELESYQDCLGKDVKVGDIVLYPYNLYRTPVTTFGRIVNIRERKDWWGGRYITVRISAVREYNWEIDADGKVIMKVGLLNSTIQTNIKRLIKVDPFILTGIFKDVLIDGQTLTVYFRSRQTDVTKEQDHTQYFYTIDESGNEVEYKSPFSK